MIKRTYTLYDSTAQIFMRPFEALNDGDAIRLFTTWINDDKNETNINKYPQQFGLWYLGDFDDKTGTYTQDSQPKEIFFGTQAVEETKLTHEQWFEKTKQYFDQGEVLPFKKGDIGQ